jgi:hypothetical protein
MFIEPYTRETDRRASSIRVELDFLICQGERVPETWRITEKFRRQSTPFHALCIGLYTRVQQL